MIDKFGEIVGKVIEFLKDILGECFDCKLYAMHPSFGIDLDLPEPLTKEEEGKLLNQIQEQSAKDELVNRNLRLALYVAKKFGNTQHDIEDLFQIGSIGLIKAVNTYSPDKNTKLVTYAVRCIENEILMDLRKAKKYKDTLYLEEPIMNDNKGNSITLGETIGDDEQGVEKIINQQDYEEIYNNIKLLNEKEAYIIEQRYCIDERKTQKEIANELGISQSYAARIEYTGLNKMRKSLSGEKEDYSL